MAEIVQTKIEDVDGAGSNFLDLEGLTWRIAGDINKNKPMKILYVEQEFADHVRHLVRKESNWLISKKGGQPYRAPVAMKHLQLSGFTLNQVRNAYVDAEGVRKTNLPNLLSS
jgi:hypothetical protein